MWRFKALVEGVCIALFAFVVFVVVAISAYYVAGWFE